MLSGELCKHLALQPVCPSFASFAFCMSFTIYRSGLRVILSLRLTSVIGPFIMIFHMCPLNPGDPGTVPCYFVDVNCFFGV